MLLWARGHLRGHPLASIHLFYVMFPFIADVSASEDGKIGGESFNSVKSGEVRGSSY